MLFPFKSMVVSDSSLDEAVGSLLHVTQVACSELFGSEAKGSTEI